MLKPAIPATERQRLKALHDLKILDTPPEERFDRVTRLARQVFGVPIALISLIDEGRQWFKSRQGLDVDETPREISFCGHAILDDRILVVNDAAEDQRFCDNPLVCGDPNIRFYAGYPIAAPDGSRVGTLCIIDDNPREITKEQLHSLRELGRMVEEELKAANDATTDPTTGLSSRAGFVTIADHLLAMCKRCERPATLLMFHLSNLGEIESRYGRDDSDAAVVEFAHQLESNLRGSDIVARTCIDVFSVFLSGTDLDGAGPAQRRLEERLSAHNRETNRPFQLDVQAHEVLYKTGRHDSAAALLEDGEVRIFAAIGEEDAPIAVGSR